MIYDAIGKIMGESKRILGIENFNHLPKPFSSSVLALPFQNITQERRAYDNNFLQYCEKTE